MTRRQKATLVFAANDDRALVDWSTMAASDSRVIIVRNLNLLEASLHLASDSLVDVEVVRVVFDQSIDAEEWLEFLTSTPIGFRGDVLFVTKEDKAFLSAVGRTDERVMYKLEGQDIRFYLEVCGIMKREDISFPYFETPLHSAEALMM